MHPKIVIQVKTFFAIVFASIKYSAFNQSSQQSFTEIDVKSEIDVNLLSVLQNTLKVKEFW